MKVLVLLFSFSLSALKLGPVSLVNPSKYAGLWYKIARLPDSFETNCIESTIEYLLQKDGSFKILNHCLKANGFEKNAEAIAEIENFPSNSKFKINFAPKWLQWTGFGVTDYWIIDLDPDYQFAVISDPSKQHLWILSRTPSLEESTYQDILAKLKNFHFDLSHLIVTNHTEARLLLSDARN